jgi:hypothetical protein
MTRVLISWVSLIHRHRRKQLERKYSELLKDKNVIGRLWAALHKMPAEHPRAEHIAHTLTNLCSLEKRPDTREAYIHLVAVDGSYFDLEHKKPTALYSLQTDPDCEYLRTVLQDQPISQEEIDQCKRSLP